MTVSAPLLVLVLYVLWTLGIVLALVACRVAWVLTGRVPSNGFPSGERHGPEWYWRIHLAHANAVENLPMVAVLIGVGTMVGVAHSPLFANAAWVALGARVAQTGFQVVSGEAWAVNLRFTAFMIQIGCLLTMAGIILSAPPTG